MYIFVVCPKEKVNWIATQSYPFWVRPESWQIRNGENLRMASCAVILYYLRNSCMVFHCSLKDGPSARLAVVQEFSTPCSVLCTHFAIHPFCLEKGKFRQQELRNDSPLPFPLSNRPMQTINFVSLIPMVLFLHLGPGPWERSWNYLPYAGTH